MTPRALAILQWFKTRGSRGGTTDECENALGLENLHTRANELVRAGRLELTAERRLTRYRRQAIVYRYRESNALVPTVARLKRVELTAQDAKLLSAARSYVKSKRSARTDVQVKAAILKLLRTLNAPVR